MSKQCAICEMGTTALFRRKIANEEVVCESCLQKAKTLSVKQIMKLKNVSAEEIKLSIEASGNSVVKISERSLEDLIEDAAPSTKCPNCNSKDIQFMQNNKKAFSIGKAAGGAILTGGIGALAGFAGKKGNDQWRCNDCGSIFATKPIK